ncbi:MAG: hypothetical protein ACOC22_03435 [bacterium]
MIKLYKRGNIVKIKVGNDIEEAIIAHVGDRKHALISLKDGNLFTDPIDVANWLKITREEVEKMLGYSEDFLLIDEEDEDVVEEFYNDEEEDDFNTGYSLQLELLNFSSVYYSNVIDSYTDKDFCYIIFIDSDENKIIDRYPIRNVLKLVSKH